MHAADSHQPPPFDFSSAAVATITSALNRYLATRGAEGRGELKSATEAVCTEAHRAGLAPEKMIIALEELFHSVPLVVSADQALRARAFEAFLTGCIAAYYNSSRT